jgi:hypothetical protein
LCRKERESNLPQAKRWFQQLRASPRAST